jgi:hypothetical protein
MDSTMQSNHVHEKKRSARSTSAEDILEMLVLLRFVKTRFKERSMQATYGTVISLACEDMQSADI